MNERLLIACCSPVPSLAWRWVSASFDSARYDWRFFFTQPRNAWEKVARRPDLARIRACRELARCVARERAGLMVSHSPLVTCWSELLARRTRRRNGGGDRGCPHLAFSFNFTHLPRHLRRGLMRRAFATVDRFVVFSEFERTLYAEYFGIPPEKIDRIPWGVEEPPPAGDSPPLMPGEYLCAVGSQARDYATLVDAMRQLPDVRLALVARPENVRGLSIPDNVTLFVNIPRGDVYNIVRSSRFMVLPLAHSQVPCGHVTLVTAMFLEKALLATESAGITDYVRTDPDSPDCNGLFCPPADAGALAEAIGRMWNDPALCARLGAAGRRFALAHCTQQTTIDYLRSTLARLESTGAI